jgi:MoaA/NifB/PqqE/SkfB family radical SAM enzyme
MAHGLKSISFLGGEPTGWPFLNKSVEYARVHGTETVIFSNASHVCTIPDLAILNISRFVERPFSPSVLRNINWYNKNKSQINFRINLTKDMSDYNLSQVLNTARSVDADIQFAAINCLPHDKVFGDKIFNWLKHFVALSFCVRITRPLLKCVFTKEQFQFIDQNCNRYKCCDFNNSVPVINPDGMTVYPCNSLPIPLSIEYVFSKRETYKEIKRLKSQMDMIVYDECLSCQEYKNKECHGGCLGARIKKIEISKSKRIFRNPTKVGSTLPVKKTFKWDWGMAAKVVAKSIRNSTLSTSGYLKVGYSCDNNCAFCTVEWQKNMGDRSYKEIIQEIDRLVNEYAIKILHYSGGEPTLHKDLPRIIEYARRKGISQQVLQTNGRRLRDRGYLKNLIDGGITSFFVSFHGANANEHNAAVNHDLAFQQSCMGLSNLVYCGAKFSTNTVITRLNKKSLAKIIQFLCREFATISKAKLSYPNLQGGAADNLKTIIIPLWDCIYGVKKAIKTGIENGIFVDTESIPICLLDDLADHACEFLQNIYYISDLQYRKANWTISNRAKGFVFYGECTACDQRKNCCGIHPLHHKRFGHRKVFNPIRFDEID